MKGVGGECEANINRRKYTVILLCNFLTKNSKPQTIRERWGARFDYIKIKSFFQQQIPEAAKDEGQIRVRYLHFIPQG